MEKRRIGSLEVSTVGLGTNNFGGRIDYDASAAVVAAALEVGINFFDTADIYGGTRSEEFLGRALGEHRNDVVIATKFGNAVDPEKKGAHPDYVVRAVEESLRRLGTDRIDLYILHTPDPSVPIADTLGALDTLVTQGKVREIGCSNFSVEQLREANDAASPGSARFTSIQNEYSLLQRAPENGMLALCEELGIAFVPYFPLASGLLTGKYRKEEPIPEGARLSKGPAGDRLLTTENLDIVGRLIDFSESRGHTILELAFSWLLAHSVVPSVIAGATSAMQVIDNAKAPNWKLTEEEMEEVDRLLAGREKGEV